jgi:hypothetical protein
MSDASQPSVVNTWVWRAVGTPPPKPKPMSIKVKALIQAPLMVAVAYALHHFTGHVIMPSVIVGLAALVLIGGLAVPAIFHAFERFGFLLARWVAAGLTWGLLVPFFYIVFGFGRLVLLMTRQDPMSIRFPAPDHTTFWEARPPVTDLSTYRRQH